MKSNFINLCLALFSFTCRSSILVTSKSTSTAKIATNNDKSDSATATTEGSGSGRTSTVADQHEYYKIPDDYYDLNEDSVVLITGAAGFLGSELAIALHRVYHVKKLILIDHMSVTPRMHFSSSSSSGTSSPDTITMVQGLHHLEYQRQRLFRVLQSVGEVAHFYRVDVRVNVPEFYQAGEVSLLRHITSLHQDITHIVHLATEASSTSITRLAPEAKAGLMETLLEELRALKLRDGDQRSLPHFVYASSSHVYNPSPDNTINPAPFAEHLPLTSPASFLGARKLMDEVLAQAYFDMDLIPSIGLRFFDVYGPWGNPNSPLYQLLENCVLNPNQKFILNDETLQTARDYIYIDDAVDAILTSMQVPVTHPLIINVGTGKPTTWKELESLLRVHVPEALLVQSNDVKKDATSSYASTDRYLKLLGSNPHVLLEEGLKRYLLWHFDRAYPFGIADTSSQSDSLHSISNMGLASCSKGDVDCTLGASVFYCAASDCANKKHCLSSMWDDVASWTRLFTKEKKCTNAVLYTIALDEGLMSLLPLNSAINSKRHSKSYLNDGCNLAFVRDTSPLVKRLLQDPASTVKSSNTELGILLVHGPWTLVPVVVTSSTPLLGNSKALTQLPKWTPSSFFISTVAVYVDPEVVFEDIQHVLREFNMPPSTGTNNTSASMTHDAMTVLMVSRDVHSDETNDYRRHVLPQRQRFSRSSLSNVQESAYRMIRIAAIDDMRSDCFVHQVDTTSFIVHRNSGDDARLFRCDILQELSAWEVVDDSHVSLALQFVASLHDLWSRVMAKKQGNRAWWSVDNMTPPFEASDSSSDRKHDKKASPEQANDNEKIDGVSAASDAKDDVKKATNEALTERHNEQRRRLFTVADEKEAVVGYGEGGSKSDTDMFVLEGDQDPNGFGVAGMPDAIQEAVRAVFGYTSKRQEDDFDEDESFDLDEPGKKNSLLQDSPANYLRTHVIDGDDLWMSVLSSSNVQYYVRIALPQQMGVFNIDGFKYYANSI